MITQVINCKDAIAQQYLMECVTHVFPLEYHVATLPVLLKHVDWLSAGANKQAGRSQRLQMEKAEARSRKTITNAS